MYLASAKGNRLNQFGMKNILDRFDMFQRILSPYGYRKRSSRGREVDKVCIIPPILEPRCPLQFKDINRGFLPALLQDVDRMPSMSSLHENWGSISDGYGGGGYPCICIQAFSHSCSRGCICYHSVLIARLGDTLPCSAGHVNIISYKDAAEMLQGSYLGCLRRGLNIITVSSRAVTDR